MELFSIHTLRRKPTIRPAQGMSPFFRKGQKAFPGSHGMAANYLLRKPSGRNRGGSEPRDQSLNFLTLRFIQGRQWTAY